MEYLTKICNKCNKTKTIQDFAKRKGIGDGYRPVCKLCIYKDKSSWIKANKDRIRRLHRIWYNSLSAEKRKKYNDLKKIWREDKNPSAAKASSDRHYRNNKEKRLRQTSAWKKANPGLHNFHSATRRARIYNATPKWANLKAIKNIYLKAAKLTKETGIQYEVDHIVPLAGKNVCGLHIHSNLQIISKIENVIKGTKWE
jgi:hypothetical protein